MTKEEKQKAIGALKISAPVMRVTQEQYEEYIQILNKIMDWLEQESYKVSVYDDDHIWYRGVQYISLRRFLEVKSEEKNEPSGNVYAIDRKLVYAFLFGLISDDVERKKALEYINELPPVDHQETVTEFADRCRECGAKYGKLLKQKGGVMTYGNGELPNGGWTPVSEGTPKENKTVIASTKYGVYPEARYSKKYGWEWAYEAGADYWRELEDVEAWMPLPKRYEPQIESEET